MGACPIRTAGLACPRSRVLVQPLGIGGQSNRREQYPMGTCPLRTIEFQSSRRALEGIAIAGSELYLYGWALVQPLCIGRGGCLKQRYPMGTCPLRTIVFQSSRLALEGKAIGESENVQKNCILKLMYPHHAAINTHLRLKVDNFQKITVESN